MVQYYQDNQDIVGSDFSDIDVYGRRFMTINGDKKFV